MIEKRWAGKGSVKGGPDRPARPRPATSRRSCAAALHYLMPIQYVVHMAPLVTISQGKIGYIFARDGKQLNPAQVLASNATVPGFPGCGGVPERTAGNAVRSAASCVKAPMPLT